MNRWLNYRSHNALDSEIPKWKNQISEKVGRYLVRVQNEGQTTQGRQQRGRRTDKRTQTLAARKRQGTNERMDGRTGAARKRRRTCHGRQLTIPFRLESEGQRSQDPPWSAKYRHKRRCSDASFCRCRVSFRLIEFVSILDEKWFSLKPDIQA